ncbi:hypothetical protein T492DRAFT_295871 [Pavlovales sp. CCMP2436]|nr:hypothetical protein T492DRAFT_295871 [Pavlovales sp. CCMP2436]
MRHRASELGGDEGSGASAQALGVLSSMLNCSAAERAQLGLEETGGATRARGGAREVRSWLRMLLPTVPEPSAHTEADAQAVSAGRKSIAEAWVEYLLDEADAEKDGLVLGAPGVAAAGSAGVPPPLPQAPAATGPSGSEAPIGQATAAPRPPSPYSASLATRAAAAAAADFPPPPPPMGTLAPSPAPSSAATEAVASGAQGVGPDGTAAAAAPSADGPPPASPYSAAAALDRPHGPLPAAQPPTPASPGSVAAAPADSAPALGETEAEGGPTTSD